MESENLNIGAMHNCTTLNLSYLILYLKRRRVGGLDSTWIGNIENQ